MSLKSIQWTYKGVRSPFRFLIYFSLLAVLIPASADKTRERQPRLVVPEQYPTIQAAIDAAPDGAKIVILPGEYREVLFIRNKHLDIDGSHGAALIRGPDPNPDTFKSLDYPKGIINYASGGGGSITALQIIGGDNAIVGFNEEEPPDAVNFKKLIVQGSGRGVLWAGAPIVISESYFSNLQWNGMSFPTCNSPTPVSITDSQVIDSGQAGIYLRDCTPIQAGIPTCGPNDHIIKGAFLSFNKGGGILAVNSQVCVQNSYINFSTWAGMILLGSAAYTSHNQIDFPKSWDGALGDGIDAWAWNGVQPTVSIDNTTVFHPERVGVGNFGGEVTLESSSIMCPSFDIQAEDWGGFQAIFYDPIPGSVKCGCPFASEPCLAKSYQLQPPPPIGGLE
jgi:hypothetical protein